MNKPKYLPRALVVAALTSLVAWLPGMACAEAAGARALLTASPPAPVASMLQWVLQFRDNEGAPFAVIDKRQAHLWLFDAAGLAKGNTPVLLGLARGDASVPGIGERPMAKIRTHERTTPAGRFVAERGRNMAGEYIFWIDYDAAISMHRVRATNPAERRLERLATPSAHDNRISYGCINVPQAFYDQALDPLFAAPRPVVYLLPETLPPGRLFAAKGAPGARPTPFLPAGAPPP